MLKICSTCSSDGKWYPCPISILEEYLSNLVVPVSGITNTGAIRKNIAYNLQYLEFQIQFLKEFKTSSVILTQTWKMATIAGMSIIETLIYYILVSKNLHKKSSWNEIKEVKIEQIKSIRGQEYKIQNLIFCKIPEKLVRMKLDSMLALASDKKIFGLNNDFYKELNYLKKLRNKIHLHIVEKDKDTDWHSFNNKDFLLLKKVLHKFLVSSYFKPTEEDRERFKFLII